MSNPRKIGDSYYQKALSCKGSGDYIGALNEIRLAVSYYPYNPTYKQEQEAIERLLDRAALSDEIFKHVRSGNYAAAVRCAEALSIQYPDRYTSLSDLASGVTLKESGKQAFPSTLVLSSEGFVKEKNFGLAMKLLTEAIALDPQNETLTIKLEELVNYHKAQLLVEGSKKYYPENIEQAISMVEKAIELFPDGKFKEILAKMINERPLMFFSYAKHLYSQKKLYEANKVLQKAMKYDPINSDYCTLQTRIENAIKQKEMDDEKKDIKRSRSRYE